jgi:hypothetical protein
MVVNTEGVRALLYRTYVLLDGVLAREAALRRDDLPEVERVRIQEEHERDTTRVRLLTPLCKYYATEVCSDLTRDALQVHGGVGFTLDSDVGKLHADSLIMTIYEGTSEIQASFALREMGKGALAVVFREVRAELDAMDGDRAALARKVGEAAIRIEGTLKVLFGDMSYALLRAKLMAEMVIDVIAATELLKQAGADPSRLDLAEAFIRRRTLAVEHAARRIEENSEGTLERDAIRVLGSCAGGGLPQWNCGGAYSVRARAGDADVPVVNASPDVREQFARFPGLHPRPGTRDVPLDTVLLTSADLDHVLGLLVLREALSYRIVSTGWVRHALLDHNAAWRLLEPAWGATALDAPVRIDRDGLLEARLFPVAPGLPPFLRDVATPDRETTVGVRITDRSSGRRLAFVPGLKSTAPSSAPTSYGSGGPARRTPRPWATCPSRGPSRASPRSPRCRAGRSTST